VISKDKAAIEKAFAKLAAGGTVTMALQATFWTELYGVVTGQVWSPLAVQPRQWKDERLAEHIGELPALLVWISCKCQVPPEVLVTNEHRWRGGGCIA